MAAISIDLSTIPVEQLEAIKLQLKPEVETQLRRENDVAIAKLKDELRQQNDVTIRKAIDDFEEKERARRTPLTPEELQKLVTKEYITFRVEVQDDEKKHTFTLKELPQSVEENFVTIAKIAMEDLLSISAEFNFQDLLKGDAFQNIVGLINVFQPAQKVLVECCQVCLNPRNKTEWLTKDWVRDNLSNYRMLTIIMAQVEVNKMRDFFYLLFMLPSNREKTNSLASTL